MNIARAFPRKTTATPDDPLVFFTAPPALLDLTHIDEVHVSVAFSYDKGAAENLAEEWYRTGIPVKIGGPAYKSPAEEFIPGRYLRQGYTITSRGCPNKCWFCGVWKTQPEAIELPIHDGYILQDDNLLACSEQHIRAVFEMLGRQDKKAILSGGMEAKLLKPWHVELLRKVKPKQIFFAYDTPDDYEPLVIAGRMLKEAGISLRSHTKLAYVLIGYPGDDQDKAEKRLIDTLKAGFMPFAMLYRDENGEVNEDWRKLQRLWTRPAIIRVRNKEIFMEEKI